jgi:nucleoside-diphosphate-sugar epimerase
MRIAITGATGFLGRRLVRIAVGAGHDVRALVRPSAEVPAAWRDEVELVEGDLADLAGESRRLLPEADVFVHLAVSGSVRGSRTWSVGYDVNVHAAVHWTRMAHAFGVPRVVGAGTCFEYAGHGTLPDAPWRGPDEAPTCAEDAPLRFTDPYGGTKALGGILARGIAAEISIPCWYARIAALYGPDDDSTGRRIVPAAVRAARERTRLPMTGGEQVREFLHVDDAARAVLVCAATPPPGGVAIANVGTELGRPLRDWARRIFELAGAPQELVDAGAIPYREGEAHHLVMRDVVLRRAAGWTPQISFDDGIRALLSADGAR